MTNRSDGTCIGLYTSRALRVRLLESDHGYSIVENRYRGVQGPKSTPFRMKKALWNADPSRSVWIWCEWERRTGEVQAEAITLTVRASVHTRFLYSSTMASRERLAAIDVSSFSITYMKACSSRFNCFVFWFGGGGGEGDTEHRHRAQAQTRRAVVSEGIGYGLPAKYV